MVEEVVNDIPNVVPVVAGILVTILIKNPMKQRGVRMKLNSVKRIVHAINSFSAIIMVN